MSEKEFRFVDFKKRALYSSVDNPHECLIAFGMMYVPCQYGHEMFMNTSVHIQGLAVDEMINGDNFFLENKIFSKTLPSDILMKLDLRYLSISFDVTKEDLSKKYKRTKWEDIMQYNYKFDIQNDELNKELYIEGSEDGSSILGRLYKSKKCNINIALSDLINRTMKDYNSMNLSRTVNSITNGLGLSYDAVSDIEIYNHPDRSKIDKFVKGNEDKVTIEEEGLDTTRITFNVCLNQSEIITSSYVEGVDYTKRDKKLWDDEMPFNAGTLSPAAQPTAKKITNTVQSIKNTTVSNSNTTNISGTTFKINSVNVVKTYPNYNLKILMGNNTTFIRFQLINRR